MSKPETLRAPNFNKAYLMANETLAISSVVNSFPFRAKELVKEQADVTFCTFKKALNKYHQDIRQFGSDSAVLIELFGSHIIFYNQAEAPYRIRYSIIHEFGHIIMGHKLNLEKTDKLYGVQEIEANYFAAQTLMPDQLLRTFAERGQQITKDFIMHSFGVSAEAAEKRTLTFSNTINEWRSREQSQYDDIIVEKYMGFLDTIAPAPTHYSYSFEEDLERERDRNSWLDNRSHW